MDTSSLPYLKEIAESLEKGASGGLNFASAISNAAIQGVGGGSALNETILRLLQDVFLTTYTPEGGTAEDTNYLRLIHDQLEDLKTLHIRDILKHLSIKKYNAGQPNEEIYLNVDIGFVGEKWGAFGGANPGGGGGGGIDLNRVWQSLTNNTDYPNTLINAHHIPIGDGLTINAQTGLIDSTLSGTVPVQHGGTGLSSIPAYSMLYARAANNLTTLAPNTTTTKKYLTMTGSGSAGSAPAWSALLFADLPAMYLLGNQVAASAARGMLKGVESFSRQMTGETPAPGSTTSGSADASYFYWDSTYSAWHYKGNLIVDGFGSFGGTQSGSGGGVNLTRVWESLTNNTDFPNTTINAAHIPVATSGSIGGIKVGNNLSIDANGVLSSTGHSYTKAELLQIIGDIFVYNTSDTMSGHLGIGEYLTVDQYATIGTYLTVGTYGSFGTNLNVGNHLTVGGDSLPYFYYDTTNSAIRFTGNFIVDGYGAFGGAQAGSTDFVLSAWRSLTNNPSLSSYGNNTAIAAAHIPVGSGLTTSNGSIIANLGRGLTTSYGAITISDIVVTTTYNGGLKLLPVNHGAVPQPGDQSYDSHTVYLERAS